MGRFARRREARRLRNLRRVTRRSVVPAEADTVWERVITPAGVNDELRPLIRMTVPRGWRDRSLDEFEPPERLGRSWLLALGLIPFDYDNLRIVEIGERRFQEDSSMLMIGVWRHERTVEPVRDGALVTDKLEFRARRPLRWNPWFERIYALVVGLLFRHRHRRLRRWAKREAALSGAGAGRPERS